MPLLVLLLLQTPLKKTNQRAVAEVFADDFMRYKLSLVSRTEDSERSKLAGSFPTRGPLPASSFGTGISYFTLTIHEP